MAPSLHKCILVAVVLASVLLHTMCDDAPSEESSEIQEHEPSMSGVLDDLKDTHEAHSSGSEAVDPLHNESVGDCDCHKHSSSPKHSDGQRWQKGNTSSPEEGNKSHSGSRRYNGTEDSRSNSTRNSTFEREGRINSEWQSSHNATLSANETPRHGNEARHHGNKTHLGNEGESYPDDHNRDGRHAEGEGKPVCDCGRQGAKGEVDPRMGNESHVASRDGASSKLYVSKANDMESRTGDSHGAASELDAGAQRKPDNHKTDNLESRTTSDKGDDEKGFANAAVLGLAGAGICVFCIASALLCMCFRRSAKTPTVSGAIVGKTLNNKPPTPEVVDGVVLNNV